VTAAIRALRGRRTGTVTFVGAILVFLVIVNVFLNPARLALSGIGTTVGLVAPLLFATLATTPSILSGGGGIDISIGPMIGLLNVGMVQYLFNNGIDSPWAVLPVVLLAGIVLGGINGLLVVRVRLQPVVATLGTYLVFLGLAPWVMPQPAGSAPDWLIRLSDDRAFVPLLVVIVVWIVVRRMPLHRYLMAIGGSDKAAYSSGINVAAVRWFAYALGGAIAAIGALALTALISSGDPNIGPSLTLKAISAAVLGGVSLVGGKGGFLGAAVGALTIFMLELSLTALGFSTFVLQMMFGIVLVLAVVFDAVAARRQ